jgi:ABC-type uncharacterized transport system ATPase component
MRQINKYLYGMEASTINIDDARMKVAMAAYVREKALKYGTEMIYRENGQIISEHPVSGRKKVLKKSAHKVH